MFLVCDIPSITRLNSPSRVAGDLPTSFGSLSALNTLHLESTAINTLPSTLFSSLKQLSTLVLVKNGNMTGDMTSGIASLPLANLYVLLIVGSTMRPY